MIRFLFCISVVRWVGVSFLKDVNDRHTQRCKRGGPLTHFFQFVDLLCCVVLGWVVHTQIAIPITHNHLPIKGHLSVDDFISF